MAVTKRDSILLDGLGCFRVLTLSQVRTHYFGGLARPLVQRRLGRLRAQNILRSYPFGEQGSLAWTLTSEGARIVGKPEKIFRRPPNRNTLRHDLVIADIGLELRRLGILHEWLSTYEIEQSLYGTDRHIPDALFRLKIGEQFFGPIALEVENTLKGRERIRSMLYEYEHWFKVTDLWMFWRKEWMAKAIKEVAEYRSEPRIWIGNSSVEDSSKLKLTCTDGSQLDLAQLAKKTDTPCDTHPISEFEAKDVLATSDKSFPSANLAKSSTLASALPDFPDPSLSTIERGQERKLDYGVSDTGGVGNLGLDGRRNYE